MIEGHGLTMAYRAGPSVTEALRGVDLDIDAGEKVALTGPSGSGKSTLLALLGALETPSEGSLKVNGQNLAAMTDSEKAQYRFAVVGFVFQEFHLLSHLTALENVLAPFMGRRGQLAAHRDRARELLSAAGLEHRAESQAGLLSGGEKQRVAVARALVNDPEIILADEPTGNLDGKNGEQVLSLLLSLSQGDRSRTVIIATHDPVVAGRLDRSIHLVDGTVADPVS